ncbi:MAG: contractile injection system protein, VgrG/Pvc8 family [Candidatus Competibacteraceae bacterium]|nr:contractile injection system protein, VgrG/Pvc8 family [Candidatus Competibacteraceae bacterium]
MADLGVTSLFYPARPTLTLDGRERGDLREGLLFLAVEETTDGLFHCEANFGNWGTRQGEVGFLYPDRRVFDFGHSLKVTMGQGSAQAQIFHGRITALEGRYPAQRTPELLVLAEDRLQDLRMTRRSRTFEETTDREVIETIAGEHDLEVEIDADGPDYPLLAQLNQSDLAFLRERARAMDAELWLEDDTLHVQARARRRSSEVTLTYGQGLREFQVSADLAQQRTALTVSGWAIDSKEAIAEQADEAAIQPELSGGDSGSQLLEGAFGARVERIVHRVPLSPPEARALAEAHYRHMARRFVCGQGVAQGDGRIRVGSRLRLKGLGGLFDGPYYVCQVRHTFDAQDGFCTRFQVERPGLGGN